MLKFHENAWEDYLYWQKTNKQILKRINTLIKDATRDPYNGIGKPEPLKGDLLGFLSRRIDSEHRLVYTIIGDDIVIVQCRYHY